MGTVERNKVFADLFNLSTFLIPRSALPDLPPDLRRRLGFYFPREWAALPDPLALKRALLAVPAGAAGRAALRGAQPSPRGRTSPARP